MTNGVGSSSAHSKPTTFEYYVLYLSHMASDSKHLTPHLFIARDIIDMARDYTDDFDALEYLSSICFNLARTFEGSDSPIDWDDLFSILEQAYFSKDSSRLADLNATYSKVVIRIENLTRNANGQSWQPPTG